MTGYAMVHYVQYDCSPVVTEIAERTGRSPYQVILRWVNQKGVVSTFSANEEWQMIANRKSLEGEDLSPEDMASIDALNENKPYFWLPEASNQTLR